MAGPSADRRGISRWSMRHDGIGYEATGIPKKSSTLLLFFFTLGLTLPVRTAFALDAPAIAPTQLDFDASRAPKSCNNRVTFDMLLRNWVAESVWTPDAARRLMVRIHRSPRGEKLVDVTLVDATGTTMAEHHQPFGVREECHRVLYEAARTAATLLGAFEKPPPPEPWPQCPPLPPPPEPAPSPACPPCPKCPVSTPPPAVRRFDFGLGALPGMGATPMQWVGPLFLLDSSRLFACRTCALNSMSLMHYRPRMHFVAI
ncbi:MAG: hypothetical protein IPM54_10835 [Polyangiaceae bacterium]|nr:hypothetical protein [Polyangiaceae bacterium]